MPFRHTVTAMKYYVNDTSVDMPPINPTPRLYFRVSWTHTLLYPESRGKQ